MSTPLLLTAALLAASTSPSSKPGSAAAEELAPPPAAVVAPTPRSTRAIGSFAAPAALPAGTMALYGQIGAPDVGAGYRQGFDGLEIEARGLFNYLELSGLIEGGLKLPVLRTDGVVVAPGLALGLRLDSGSRYYDRFNFSSFSVRPRASVNTSLKITDTVQALILLDLPLALSVNVSGTQFTPTVGAGAEFHVGEGLSLGATLHGGVDLIKEPLGVPQLRPAWGVRLGLGYRVF